MGACAGRPVAVEQIQSLDAGITSNLYPSLIEWQPIMLEAELETKEAIIAQEQVRSCGETGALVDLYDSTAVDIVMEAEIPKPTQSVRAIAEETAGVKVIVGQQPAVAVIVQSYESTEDEVTVSNQHTLAAVQTCEEAKVKSSGFRTDTGGQQLDVVVQNYGSAEIEATGEKLQQSSSLVERGALQTWEGVKDKPIIRHPDNTLGHTIGSLCCGAPDNSLEPAISLCGRDLEKTSAVRRPYNTLESAIVSFCCGSKQRSAIRRPDNPLEYACVACFCWAEKNENGFTLLSKKQQGHSSFLGSNLL